MEEFLSRMSDLEDRFSNAKSSMQISQEQNIKVKRQLTTTTTSKIKDFTIIRHGKEYGVKILDETKKTENFNI